MTRAGLPPLVTGAQITALTGVTLAADRAEAMSEAASALVRGYCGWHLAPTRVEEVTADGSGTCVQLLPTLRLVDLLTLTVDGTPVVIDTVGWSAAGVLTWPRPFSCRPRSVSAQIEHGHPELPEVTALCAGVIARAANTAPGLSGWTVGSVTVTYDVPTAGAVGTLALAPHELTVLDRYRLAVRP